MEKLASALAKAQSKFQAPVKNKKVDFTDKNGRRVKYNYADLADVIEAVKLPLSENALSISHRLSNVENNLYLVTVLMHSSGELIESWYPLPHPADIKPQEFGSALTYARRYSLSSIVGIASDEDDDGAIAEGPKKPEGKKSNPQSPQTNPQSHGTYTGKSRFEAEPEDFFDPNDPFPEGDSIVDDLPKKGQDVFLPGDFEMPLNNKFKGHKLKTIPVQELKNTLKWCKESKNPGVNVKTTGQFIESYLGTL